MEINLLRTRCTRCYYYGKVCGFGKGKIAAALFAKDEEHEFTGAEISFIKLIPDLLISLIPIIGGIISLIISFQVIVLVCLIIFITLSFFVTGKIRGELVCKNCKQGDIGCPATEFFSKKVGSKKEEN
jgi:hypothetical protein